MVKAYAGVLIVADILLIFLKMLYYIGEGFYRIFVSPEEANVAGEIVLVTGAGHGIGKELALKYGSLGATVVCWDLNPQGNDETVNEIKKLGTTNAYGYKCDVSNREEVLKVAEKVKHEVGDVTILVNNAGIMPCRPFLEWTPEEIRRTMDINVMAHYWTLQAFLPGMIQKNHGHIVALSSMAGFLGVPNLVPYCASKFAVRGMMEAMKEELRMVNKEKVSNIKFTTICPYIVDTGLCKNTRIRFPDLMASVPPKEAAAQIVKGQRQSVTELSIPGYWIHVNTVARCLPEQTRLCLLDFVDSGVDPDI